MTMHHWLQLLADLRASYGPDARWSTIPRPLGALESHTKRSEAERRGEISSGIAYRRAKMQAPDGTLNPASREATAGVGLADQVGSLPTTDSIFSGGVAPGKATLGVAAYPSAVAPSPELLHPSTARTRRAE
jgi:hypothetical protein